MPSKNKRAKASHDPDQQPSLLEALEPNEGPEQDKHKQPGIENESPGGQNGDRETSGEDVEREDAEREDEDRSVAKDQPSQPTRQPTEPLKKAYDRYVEIVGATYDSKFSDAKRNAAFKEAAKTHGIRVTDLKRYSTAAALGIPYHGGAESEPGTDDTLPASQND